MPFDELIRKVDELQAGRFFGEDVVCQIGHSEFQPRHCEHFQFGKDLAEYYENASFLIVHGGTGSTLEALISQKPFIAFANPLSADDHQAQFLQRMEREYGVVWSRDLEQLPMLFDKALARHAKTRLNERSRLADRILKLTGKE